MFIKLFVIIILWYVSQIIMLYTVNSYSAVFQLYYIMIPVLFTYHRFGDVQSNSV